MTPNTDPIAEMDRAVICLAAEVPDSVYRDVRLRWHAALIDLDLNKHCCQQAEQEATKLRLVLREAFAVDARPTHQRMIDAANEVGLDLERLFAKPEG